MTDRRVVALGDSAIRIDFDERIDPVVNDAVIALAQSIESAALPGIRDVVPTFRSVAVYFDPLRTDYDALIARVTRNGSPGVRTTAVGTELIRVPVCYEGEYGPDTPAVAAAAGIDEADVVRLHTAPTYRVFMLGFLPGFAYMACVDERIATPRLSVPRTRVPAGAVGIAGRQTGIYSAATPGGWRILGRTPIKPFDARRAVPFLFKPGDAVQFYPIDRTEFLRREQEESR